MATNKGNKQSGSRGGQGSGTSNRGFASMDPERQREIASEGGKAAHEKGTAHEFTSEEARRAGSMSHGNRQSAQSSSRTGGAGKESSKQTDQSVNRGGSVQGDVEDDLGDDIGGSQSR
jgi:general stress protein YciG